jgi:hypothetical protein
VVVLVLVLAVLALLFLFVIVGRPLLRHEGDPETSGIAEMAPPIEVRDPTLIDFYAMQLALRSTSWVSRRVERFDFLDATTVRRHMSVDFTLPYIGPDDRLIEEEVVFVPLMLLRRGGMLRGVDVTDADGRSLNVIESAEGNVVALAGIRALVASIAKVKLAEVPSRDLERILRHKRKSASKLAETALDPKRGEIGKLLDPSLPPGSTQAETDALAEQVDTIKALIKEMASGFPLLVAVPYRPQVQTLVKVSYLTRFKSSVLKPWRQGQKPAAIRLLANRLFSSLALVGRVEYFTGLEVRRSKSYHAEIVPASGTYCEEANLCLRYPEEVKEGRVTRGVYRDFNHSRPHLWVGDGDDTDRAEEGVLEVALFAEREGLILPLLVSAALIAGVLSLVLRHHPDVDGVTLGAVLLAPIALAAYYARTDENGYLTMAMRGVRYVGLASTIAAIIAIALVALGYLEVPDGNGRTRTLGTPAALCVMEVVAWVALVCTVLLAMALCGPIVSERFRRFWFRRTTNPLPRGGKMGQPDLRMTVVPAMLLFTAGTLATIILAKVLHM